MWLPLILNTALPLALLLTLNSFIYARLATVRQIQIHKYTNTKIHKYKYTNIQTYKYTNTNTQIYKHTNTQIQLLLTLNSFIYARLTTVRQIQIQIDKHTNTQIQLLPKAKH